MDGMMNIVRISFYAVALTITLPTESYAGFIWLDPVWDVTLDQIVDKGTGSKKRAFGSSAVADGEIKNLDSDLAAARAEALASTDANVNQNSFWRAGVDFERRFRLSDSPGGWIVQLAGVLSGRLAIIDPNDLSQVGVDGSAAIFDENGLVIDDNGVAFSIDAGQTTDKNGVVDLFQLPSITMILKNGDYRISGALAVSAFVNSEPLQADAQSRFFDGGWTVSLSARAIPEPSSLLLVLSAGLLWVAGQLLSNPSLRLFLLPESLRQRQAGKIFRSQPAVGFDAETLEHSEQLACVLCRMPG